MSNGFDFDGCPTSKLIVTFPNTGPGRQAREFLDGRWPGDLGVSPIGTMEDFLRGTRAVEMAVKAPLLYSRYLVPLGEENDSAQRIFSSFEGKEGAIAAVEQDYPITFSSFAPGGAHPDYLDMMGVPHAHSARVEGHNRRIAILDSGIDPPSPFVARYFDMATDPVTAGARQDQLGHGTAMAHLAHSIAPAAELSVVRINDGPHRPSVFGLIGGLFVAAADVSADIISMSLGFPKILNCSSCGGTVTMQSYALETVVALVASRANSNGRAPILLAATGNDGISTGIHTPANYGAPNVVAVGSVDRTGQRSVFSNYDLGRPASGHVMAPGGAGPIGAHTEICGTGKYGDVCAGTSPATAYAAGMMALLWSDPRYARRDRDTFLRHVFQRHCIKQAGHSRAEYGQGMLKWMPRSALKGRNRGRSHIFHV